MRKSGVLMIVAIMTLSTLSILAPPVMAAPGFVPIVTDSIDGIATIYADGGGGGVGLQANHTSWIIGRDLSNQFNVAQCPEELSDSGLSFAGIDWFSYSAGAQWALGDGWVVGDNSMNLARLEFGRTYTHNSALVKTLTNYSAVQTQILNALNPQWFVEPYAVFEPIPMPTHDGIQLTWSDWTNTNNTAACVGWPVPSSGTEGPTFASNLAPPPPAWPERPG